jgi:hypothetical protein
VGSTGCAGSRAASTEERIFSSADMMAVVGGAAWRGTVKGSSRSVVGSERKRKAVAALGSLRADWARSLTDGGGRSGVQRTQCVAQATLKSCDGAYKRE